MTPTEIVVLRFGDRRLPRALAALRCCEADDVTALDEAIRDARRVVVAGGDSSGEVASALGIDALTVVSGLAPGAPLCRAWSSDARRDSLEIALKGGQMGDADFFGVARDGRSAAGPGLSPPASRPPHPPRAT